MRLSAEERIEPFFMSYRGFFSVSGKYGSFIGQAEQLLFDGFSQKHDASARKVGPSDGFLEKNIPRKKISPDEK